MYYKIKKISNLSSVFQVSLFRHYRRLLAPLNPTSTFFQNWLTLISLIILGYALLQSTFVVFGVSLIWLLIPSSKLLLWYTPISLSFWILSISLLTSLHSLKICFSLPKEFRAVLLIEQGLSLKTFLSKSSTMVKKIGLLLILLMFLCFFFPQLFIALVWGMPIFVEYYTLSGVTNSFLLKKITKMPNQTLSTFLGFEYNYLNTNPKNFFFFSDDFYDNWVDEEQDNMEDATGEEDEELEMSEDFSADDFADFDFEQEDAEDDWIDNNTFGYAFDRTYNYSMYSLLQNEKRWHKQDLPSLKVFRDDDTENEDDLDMLLLRKNFPEFFQLQDISLDLKYQYQKVPLLYKYLKAQRDIKNQNLTNDNLQNFSKYQTIEKRLWTKTHLNLDVLRLPTAQPWYNAGFPELFDNIFSDYEDISDYIHEADAGDDDFIDTDEDPDFDILYAEGHDFSLYGNSDEIYDEPGSGNEYKSPNWFLIAFCYYTISFWAVLNCFLFVFLFICGIPETWVLSYRTAASQNILLYKTLLHMTEQLYTKWGFAKLPVGGYCRLEYFNYLQPSYFPRTAKVVKNFTTVKSGYKLHPWNWWYWGRTYKHWNVYGILQGSSHFSKNPRFSTFDTYWLRKHSSILFQNRMSLSQNVGLEYINNEFFDKKEKQIFDFYQIMDKVQKNNK